MSAARQTLAWIAAFGGGGLLFAAVKGYHPIEEVAAAISGSASGGPDHAWWTSPESASSTPGDTGSVGTTPAVDSPATSTSGSGGPVPQSATVPVAVPKTEDGASSIRLVPASAAAFVAWQAAYGAGIPCTSGWRDQAEQARQHAADPQRFGSATGSWHTAGKAVDVDNVWLSALPAAQQSKLRTAAKATGWNQARWGGEATCGSNTSNDTEPWHFSHGGCG